MNFRARKCDRPDCGLRFPVESGSPLGAQCPHCGGPTRFVDDDYTTHPAPGEAPDGAPEVELLIDNVRSLRNVGSMFRTADGAGIAHLHLCGFSPTPEHPKMAKTSLGAEKAVPWTRYRDAVVAAQSLRASGKRLWALEAGSDSESLFGIPLSELTGDRSTIVLVVGHEVSGLDARVADLCDRIVHIPMLGIKGSLNVGVALGVAVYWMRFAASTFGHAK